MVQRRVDEGGLREFHGRENREPVVPGGEPRAALPAVELSGRVLGGSHGGRESDPAVTVESERCGSVVRADYLREGANRHAAARDDRRRAAVSRWSPGISEDVCVPKCDLAGSDPYP